MGSADWMTRNLTRRVEVVTPIEDESSKQEIQVRGKNWEPWLCVMPEYRPFCDLRSVPEAGTRYFIFWSLQSSALIRSLTPDMGFGAVFLPTLVRSGWICSLSSISHFCRKLWMHACVIRGEAGKWDQMDATSCLALAQWRNHPANTFLKLHLQDWSQLLSKWVYMWASWRRLQSVAAKLRKWTWGKKMGVSRNGSIKMATKNNLYIEFSF